MNNLIIAPHPDDEVLGCFSFLGEDTMVVYLTTFHPLFLEGQNKQEMKVLANNLDFEVETIEEMKNDTNELDSWYTDAFIVKIEEIINRVKPHTVLIPNPSYNQDHRAVYDVALTAMRHHDTNFFVKRILLYEQPETWDTMRKPEPFRANYFRKIDILQKIDAVQIYHSQLRGHRSCDYIKAIAEVRGNQANMKFAEAFEVVRWVD